MSEEQLDKGRRYVQDARAHGKSDRDIRRTLERAGWRESRIDQLLSTPAPSSGGASQESPSKRSEVAPYTGKIDAGRTLKDATDALRQAPIPFLVGGLAVGLSAVAFLLFLLYFSADVASGSPGATGLHLVAVVALLALGFACLCRMAIQVLRGQQASLATWGDIWRSAPRALVVGAICIVILSIAVFGPIMIMQGAVQQEGGGSSIEAKAIGFWVKLMFALPFSFVFTYLVALPALSMALPAVADGAGVGRALLVSFTRGFSNFPAMLLLGITATAVFYAALLFMPALAVVIPWVAALVSSAYLQATGGGSQRDSRLRAVRGPAHSVHPKR